MLMSSGVKEKSSEREWFNQESPNCGELGPGAECLFFGANYVNSVHLCNTFSFKKNVGGLCSFPSDGF